ncbi:MFS transporter [Pasteurellaceae bacterium RH1A]|nr:MFS transporter [Pasteurellaceae bacterium RH1A]
MSVDKTDYRGLGWVAAIAFFMQALDSTILNTALPAISQSLNTSPLNMQMAIISYALTVAALIPLSGWLADRFGTLKIFRLAIGLFVLGSLACALSYSLNSLITARILQGLGGALMMPVARLAIIRSVPKAQLVATWNLMATAGLVGPILGPMVGGWLATHASWHWIFLINLPIGLFGLLISGHYMPNLTREAISFDGRGFMLFAASLVLLTLGLEMMAEEMAKINQALLLLALGLAFMGLYALHDHYSPKAILPLKLFRVRTFGLSMLANLFIRLCNAGVPFLVPLMLQLAYGYSADKAGLLVAPMALGAILAKRAIVPTLKRFGYKRTLQANALAMSLTIASLALLHAQSPLWLICLILLLCGVCNSFMFTCINTLTVSDLSDSQASAGATFLSVIQQVGIGIGIAVASVILNALRASQLPLEQAFSATFVSVAGFGLVLLALLSCLRPQDGQQITSK